MQTGMPIPLHRSTLLFLVLGLFLPQYFLHAQEQPETLNVKFRVYLWSNPPQTQQKVEMTDVNGEPPPLMDYKTPTISYMDGPNRSKSIHAAARRLSRTYTYQGTNPLVFVDEHTTGPDGEPVYTELGRVTLPTNASEVILFLFPNPTSVQVHYNIVAIPAAAEDIPSGDALVMNISGTQIAAKIGEQQVVLDNSATQRIRIGSPKNSILPIMIGAPDENGQWQRKFSQPIVVNNNAGSILLFYTANNSYRVAVLSTDS